MSSNSINNNIPFLGLTFKNFDKNGDGKIDEKEYNEALSLFMTNLENYANNNNATTNPIQNDSSDQTAAQSIQNQSDLTNQYNISINQLNIMADSMNYNDDTNEINGQFSGNNDNTGNNKNSNLLDYDEVKAKIIQGTTIGADNSTGNSGNSSNSVDNNTGVNGTNNNNSGSNTVNGNSNTNSSVENAGNSGNSSNSNNNTNVNGTSNSNNESGTVNENSDTEAKANLDVRDGFNPKGIATALHEALNQAGTNDDIVEKYLGDGEYTEDELRLVVKAYEEKYDKKLEDDINEEWGWLTGFHQEKYAGKIQSLSIVTSEIKDENGNYNADVVNDLADEFYEACKPWGTDEKAVYKIMSLEPGLRKEIIKAYNSGYGDAYKSGYDFKKTIEDEFSGDKKEELLKMYDEAMNSDKE